VTASAGRPLAGRRVVVTRAREQAGGFVERLEALGAEVVALPTIRVADPEDPALLRRAAAEAGTFDWVVFTSANAVERFFAALAGAGRALAPGTVRTCAVGPATAAALEARGLRADVVPGEFVGEAVVEALAAAGELRGKRVLLPRATEARAVLPEGLRARGAEVVEVAAYRTVPDGAGAEGLRARLAAGEVDVVTFTAGSTARSFAALLGTDVGGAKVASIGPVTSAVLRELGLPVDIEAKEYTVPGIVAAIVDYYGGDP
jgi:uroporphyrinogen III methyltransferase / synthase